MGPATQPRWYVTLRRLALLGRGFAYALLGALAIVVALGANGANAAPGALRWIGHSAVGSTVLLLVALGLGAYGLWRLVEGLAEPAARPAIGARRQRRVLEALSGAGYAAVAVFFGHLALAGDGTPWSHAAMATDGGRLLVVAIGVALTALAAVQVFDAIEARFLERWELDSFTREERAAATTLSRLGLIARSLVLLMVGGFLLNTAARSAYEPFELGMALEQLALQPYGPTLLGAFAVMAATFSAHQFLQGWYRGDEA